jgi:hypothetical protein
MFHITLYILEFVQLQVVGKASFNNNPYIVWPVVIGLLIIVILGVRVYIMEKRKENSSQRRA